MNIRVEGLRAAETTTASRCESEPDYSQLKAAPARVAKASIKGEHMADLMLHKPCRIERGGILTDKGAQMTNTGFGRVVVSQLDQRCIPLDANAGHVVS